MIPALESNTDECESWTKSWLTTSCIVAKTRAESVHRTSGSEDASLRVESTAQNAQDHGSMRWNGFMDGWTVMVCPPSWSDFAATPTPRRLDRIQQYDDHEY